MFAAYLSDADSTWMQSQECRHKRRIELADPYFLPYSRLRPRDSNRIAVSHSDSAIHSKGG